MASTLLEGHKKWKPTNGDGSPKTEKCDNSSPDMEDGEDDDGYGEERERTLRSPAPASIIGWPKRSKRGKEKLKREGEVEAMKKKIDGLMRIETSTPRKGGKKS